MAESRVKTVLRDLAGASIVIAAVVGIGYLLGVWTGFPKGTDAYAHLTRLRFVAENFPRHEWLYAWSAGMPTFETYPELPYLIAKPVTDQLGAPMALQGMAFVAMLLLGLGLYGTVRVATRSQIAGVVAALAGIGSMATWTWIVNGGVYARVLAAGLGACACWAAAIWIARGGRLAFVLSATLLAAAIASHQVVGAVFALGAGVAVIAYGRPGRLGRGALLAVTTFLLASPAIVPALFRYGGFAGTFLGLDRPQLASSATVLLDPRHIGVAVVPILIIALFAGGFASGGVKLLLVGVALCVGYLFAPSLGIPSRHYYVNGIEPFTITFLVAVVGAVAGGVALGIARRRAETPRWRAHGAAAIAVGFVAANIWLGTTAFLAGQGYPRVEDTSARSSIEDLARRTLRIDDQLAQRFLPATAAESVWFSYLYRKPQLRDYYLQGVVHPDWLAWVNASIYTPPFNQERFRSALEWFAIDGFSVFDDPNFTGNVSSFETEGGARLVATSDPPVFRQYAVSDAKPIWRPTNAPLVVVVGDRDEYDTVARMLLERDARPGTRIPIWWQGTADDLPRDLVDRAGAIVVQDGRFGDGAAAERMLESYATQGGRVLLDARTAGILSALWPVAASSDESIDEWRLRALTSGVRVDQFGPARYDDGPWGAPVGTAVREGAVAVLEQEGRPLVAERAVGNGAVIWVGGNLFYHAKSYANDAETQFLIGLLGPSGAAPAAAGSPSRLDPERVTVEVPGARGMFVSESYHPRWSARWSDGSAANVYYAGPGLMYVPLPAGSGRVTLEWTRVWSDYLVWVLVLIGIALCVWPRSRGGVTV